MTYPDTTSLDIPNWFVRLTSGVITLAIPWAIWVTVQLATITVRLESTIDLHDQLNGLTAKLTVHLTDPEIHHAPIRDSLRRIERLESKVEKLRHGE